LGHHFPRGLFVPISCPIFLDKAHGISLDWHQKSSKYTVKLCPVTFR